MASENLVTATDQILGRIKDQWDADAQTAIGAAVAPLLLFEATERDQRPHPATLALPWARAVVRHADGGSAAIGGPDGVTKRFQRSGLVWVQCFVPNVDGSTYTSAQQLAQVAQKAYEGKRAGGVVFTKVVAKEFGNDGSFYRWDVIVTFNYTEIR